MRDINRFQHSPAYHLLYQQSLSISCSTPSHTNIQDYPAVQNKSFIYSRLSCSTPSHTNIQDYPALHLVIQIFKIILQYIKPYIDYPAVQLVVQNIQDYAAVHLVIQIFIIILQYT